MPVLSKIIRTEEKVVRENRGFLKMADITRFIKEQQADFETALSEIRSGRKRSHWMWYIFPQLKGLGMTSTADYYGIDGSGANCGNTDDTEGGNNGWEWSFQFCC